MVVACNITWSCTCLQASSLRVCSEYERNREFNVLTVCRLAYFLLGWIHAALLQCAAGVNETATNRETPTLQKRPITDNTIIL